MREEEERRKESDGGPSDLHAKNTITATVGVTTAWEISRMLSNNTKTDTEEKDEVRLHQRGV